MKKPVQPVAVRILRSLIDQAEAAGLAAIPVADLKAALDRIDG